jgi:hypothetical protein
MPDRSPLVVHNFATKTEELHETAPRHIWSGRKETKRYLRPDLRVEYGGRFAPKARETTTLGSVKESLGLKSDACLNDVLKRYRKQLELELSETLGAQSSRQERAVQPGKAENFVVSSFWACATGAIRSSRRAQRLEGAYRSCGNETNAPWRDMGWQKTNCRGHCLVLEAVGTL